MSDVLDKIIDFSKILEEADFLPTVFGNFLSEAVNNKRPVILYGAGSAGKDLFECLKIHKIDVTCFCDKNEDLIGTTLFGIPVISFDDLEKLHKDSIIIIASNNYKNEIKDKLKGCKFSRIAYVSNDEQLFYYTQFNKWHYDFDSLLKDSEKIEKAYNLLSDKKSQLLFLKKIALFSLYADYELYVQFISEFAEDICFLDQIDHEIKIFSRCYEDYLYFNNDVLGINNNEVLLDVGAFDGGATVEFINRCRKYSLCYSHIYCIEADPDNYNKLLVNTKSYDNVTNMCFGLWSKATRIKFATSRLILEAASASIVDEETGMTENRIVCEGDSYIDTVTIDEQFYDKGISFIKMDIEGSEVEAIKGARETIKKYKPKLAISVYHKKTDIYEIPLLIQEICPEYKFYLRHFSTHLSETVLLAKV